MLKVQTLPPYKRRNKSKVNHDNTATHVLPPFCYCQIQFNPDTKIFVPASFRHSIVYKASVTLMSNTHSSVPRDIYILLLDKYMALNKHKRGPKPAAINL